MEYTLQVKRSKDYYYVNAFDNNNNRIGKLGVYVDGKVAKIIYVITNLSACGNGIATSMLNKTIEDFKGYELCLNVVPMPRVGESINHRTVSGLVAFYKKFGFERTDDPCLPTMIRKASLPTLGE